MVNFDRKRMTHTQTPKYERDLISDVPVSLFRVFRFRFRFRFLLFDFYGFGFGFSISFLRFRFRFRFYLLNFTVSVSVFKKRRLTDISVSIFHISFQLSCLVKYRFLKVLFIYFRFRLVKVKRK